MADTSRWWLMLPAPVRQLPADLAAVILLTGLTVIAVITPGIQETPFFAVFGLPFVLFVPGYALLAALFPRAGKPPSANDGDAEGTAERLHKSVARNGVDGIRRVGSSVGVSSAVVLPIGLVLNFTPFGIRLVPTLISITGFTVVMVAIAAHRRWQVPREDRLQVPYQAWLQAGREKLIRSDSRMNSVLSVLLVVSVLLAGAGYAVTVPKQGEAFTEQYLLTEEENGTFNADNYPTEFEVDETRSIIVGIGNHEHRDVTYSLVLELQEVRVENDSLTVLNETELDRFQTRVDDGETDHQELNITPQVTGTRLRLAFLLYKDAPPANPTVENAYRETRLWINVSTPQ